VYNVFFINFISIINIPKSSQLISLTAKTALITGGARRLGRYISYFLADEGYSLAIIYNSTSRSELLKTSAYLKSRSVRYKFYKCDLRNTAKLEKIISKAGSDFKKFDILINNAGIIKKIDFSKITGNIFDDFISVNLKAALFTSQFCLKYLKKSKTPLIINIASLGGIQNWTNYIPYSISKAGLIKLTYLLAKKLAPSIRVNAIAPGTILIKNEKAGTPEKTPMNKIPLKKYGTAKDITEAVRYLIKSTYVTGEVLTVDGGKLLS
jgi:pteridine reductase